jgi:hypothetical protein
MVTLATVPRHKQKELFPGSKTDPTSWTTLAQYKRYYLAFPFYPFRTLCPRDLASFGDNEFERASPVFPANTQINIGFQRRPNANIINYMLPCNLNTERGSVSDSLTADERRNALSFTVRTINAAGAVENTNYEILSMEINIQDMYLQVSEIFY